MFENSWNINTDKSLLTLACWVISENKQHPHDDHLRPSLSSFFFNVPLYVCNLQSWLKEIYLVINYDINIVRELQAVGGWKHLRRLKPTVYVSRMPHLIRTPLCLTLTITPLPLLPLLFYQCFLPLSVLLNSSNQMSSFSPPPPPSFFLWSLCLCSARLFHFISGVSFSVLAIPSSQFYSCFHTPRPVSTHARTLTHTHKQCTHACAC